jgi:hypothetical protein
LGSAHAGVFDLRSEEVDARVETHGAPDARRVHRRRLRRRSDSRQANPRGAAVSFSSDLVGIFRACSGHVQLSVPCGCTCVIVSFLALCNNVLLFHICNCLLMDCITLSRLSVGCLCNQVVLLLIVDLVEFA